MVLLAASTMEPNVALHQNSRQTSIAGQVPRFAFRSQQAIRALAQYLLLRIYFAASFTLNYTLLVTQIFTFGSYSTSRFLAVRTTSALKSMCGAIWNSRRIRRLRKRIEFEFFVLILSPSGNNLFLLLFWPGWLLIAAAAWSLSIWAR
ncbi:hypothetical protein NKR19_g1564 [Coniochaeta hoffmannii]|uniref:Uncharacterized protein n=1 Tax=Coniochaeta hoffmannii TaxID=91930 RepID=A0AA38SC95_9PEZI|nr:hypothetical protein NKR19_g1564 [Coniochaeta hoffmannii]